MRTPSARGLLAAVLPCALLLLAPLRAEAFGLGTTLGLPTDGPVGGFPPTLDLIFDPLILQIHALDTLQAAFDGDLFLGANLYVDVASVPIAGPVSAVVQPGGGVDLFGNPADLAISGQCRFGVQAGGGSAAVAPATSATSGSAGFGVYVVPEIGFVTNGGNEELYAGGGLQVSVWFPL